MTLLSLIKFLSNKKIDAKKDAVFLGTLSQPHGNAARIYPRVFGRNEVERENKELRFISLFLKSPLDVLNEGMLDTCVKNDDRNKKN